MVVLVASFSYCPGICLERLRNTIKFFRIGGILPENWMECLPHTSVHYCCYPTCLVLTFGLFELHFYEVKCLKEQNWASFIRNLSTWRGVIYIHILVVLLLGKEPTECDSVWSSEPVWTLWGMVNSLALPGTES
jgi:hypothetical protein